MNDGHLQLLGSRDWHRYLAVEIVPWIVTAGDLTGDVLEVGPGPGLMTDLLLAHAASLVAVEIDPVLAAALSQRMGSAPVEVLWADATVTELPSARFSTAVACTMLHHVPSPAAQDALFAEVHRLVRPGGRFLGVDSLDSPELRAFHVDDTFVPVNLETLGGRLEHAGFTDVAVEAWTASTRSGAKVRFVATKE